MLLVAAEGGGARAAYFSALVLEELRRCPRLLRHTFLIAGVSGGSVGRRWWRPRLRRRRCARRSPGRAPPPPPDACEMSSRIRPVAATAIGADADTSQALHADLLSPLIRRAVLLPTWSPAAAGRSRRLLPRTRCGN